MKFLLSVRTGLLELAKEEVKRTGLSIMNALQGFEK